MPLQETSGNATTDAYGGGVAAVPNYIESVFSTYLYTGTGVDQTITNGIDLAGKGGLVWVKSRSAVKNNCLVDTVRGVSKALASNTTGAQDNSPGYYVNAFNANGFGVGAVGDVNGSGVTFGTWTFRKQPKFFDVVTWTGTGTSSRSITHNLGAQPGFIIVKRTDTTSDWLATHIYVAGEDRYFNLNTTAAGTGSTTGPAANGYAGINGTSDATFFNIYSGSSGNSAVNASGGTYVAYLFAHNAGGFGLTGTDNVISCGSYTGAGSPYTGGSEVTLGYEPQWLLIKRADTGTANWVLLDNMRGLTADGTNENWLYPNLSDAEGTSGTLCKITATGFKPYGSSLTNNTGTYIYIAIRRGPMKVPTSGTSVYNAISRTGTGATANVTGVGFPPDMLLDTMRSTNWTRSMWDRLRGPNLRVATNQTSAETSYTDAVMSYNQDGVTLGADGNFDVNGSGYTYINWFFRRAPSFFDEVCYTYTSGSFVANHNLGVTPEMVILKRRDSTGNWFVYHQALGFSQRLNLNTTDSVIAASAITAASSTTFTTGFPGVGGATVVSYLFATCAGVSKVGSYTGNGSTQTINCGFTGGARFVLIKRTDSTGDWYVYDTARGMTVLTDPYLLLNSTAAESATLGSVTTVSTGFAVDASILAAINTNGASYIFLAIA